MGSRVGKLASHICPSDLREGNAFTICDDWGDPVHSFLVYPPQKIFGFKNCIVLHKRGNLGLEVTTLREVDVNYPGSEVRRIERF